jgi:hypothetical protein
MYTNIELFWNKERVKNTRAASVKEVNSWADESEWRKMRCAEEIQKKNPLVQTNLRGRRRDGVS